MTASRLGRVGKGLVPQCLGLKVEVLALSLVAIARSSPPLFTTPPCHVMPCPSLPSKHSFLRSSLASNKRRTHLVLTRDSSMSSTRPRSLRTTLLQPGRLTCSALNPSLHRGCIVAAYADSEAKDLRQGPDLGLDRYIGINSIDPIRSRRWVPKTRGLMSLILLCCHAPRRRQELPRHQVSVNNLV